MLVQAVILSGGSGTRLWPLSREKHPKQLLALFNEHTMLQATALRLKHLSQQHAAYPLHSKLMVVSNEDYRFITAEQLREIDCVDCELILEPLGRNTAPALTLAALCSLRDHEDSIMIVMPADHNIADERAFHAAIAKALPEAEKGAMVTFGIVPNRPETGYGYIQCGVARNEGVLQLNAFVEKPNAATAQSYIEQGNYLWNSGIFMMRASIWLKAIQALNPNIYHQCHIALQGGESHHNFTRLDKTAFEACPSDSIDYAVMEKILKQTQLGIPACVVPLDAGWSDVGAWHAVWEESEHDASGNATRGDVLVEHTKNSFVHSTHRLVACLGMDDTIVVETADAVLVTNKNHTSEIKSIISKLKEHHYTQKDTHRKVVRPWGYYDSLDSAEHFHVKRIVVKPGGILSLQKHSQRAEHWIMVSGTARVTRGEEIMTLHANESTYIPIETKHRLENIGAIDLEMIEVQTGDYFGEDDIVRYEDVYGRCDKK